MTLIPCPECNHNVSTKAISCPSCGYGMREVAKTRARRGAVLASLGLFGAIAAISAIVQVHDKVVSASAGYTASPTPPVAAVFFLRDETAACRKIEDLRKLDDMADQDDEQGFNVFLAEKSQAGDCKVLSRGTAVRVESNDVPSYPCVTAAGEPSCVFLPSNDLTNQKS